MDYQPNETIALPVSIRPAQQQGVWRELLETSIPAPAGLAARDTLRFEASYCLYGHELDEETSPLEAGLGWVVKLEKGSFSGRAVLLAQKEGGAPRTLVGFETLGRSIAREGYPILHRGERVGFVTSGTFAPYLETNLAMALVDTSRVGEREGWLAEIRTKRVELRRTELPFYRR